MNSAIRTGIRPPRALCHAIGDPDAPQWMRFPVTRPRTLGFAFLVVVAALAAGAGPARPEEGTTLAALEIAYGRERNAHAHRLAYASAAEREGQCAAACLFRASAAADSIHAERIAAAIERLDARPSWALARVVVGGTADNLKACLEREIEERDRIYARFARYAREECLYDAAAALQYARAAGGTQVALFQGALERLERKKAPPAIAMASPPDIDLTAADDCAATYHLCPGDGSLFTGPIAKGCPNCGSRGSRALVLACMPGGTAGSTGERGGQVAAR